LQAEALSNGFLPLSGVRVLELSIALAGPFAGRTLGDLGAEVIKVEPPEGEPSRKFGPYFLNGESYYFLAFNRNKKSVVLNLRHPEGRRLFLEMARRSDIILENFRPGVMDRLGIGYEAVRAVNPRIIYCSISGFGQDTSWSQRPAFDAIAQALGGVMSVTGEPGRPPVVCGFPIGDLGGAFGGLIAILTALYHRERTGQGARLDISMLDIQIALQGHLGALYLASGEVPGPQGSSHSPNTPVGAFECADGRYLLVQCTTQKFWENLAHLLARTVEGLEGLPEDPRFLTQPDRYAHREELFALLRPAFRTRTREEWVRLLEEADVPHAPIQTLAEACASPPVVERRMVVQVPHPRDGTFRASGNPFRLVGMGERLEPPPLLGQHTGEVLTGLLGLDPAQVERLRAEGVVE